MKLRIAIEKFRGCTFWENIKLSWFTVLKDEPEIKRVTRTRIIEQNGKKFSFRGNYRKEEIDFHLKVHENSGHECILRLLPFDENASDMMMKLNREFYMLYVEEPEPVEPMTEKELRDFLGVTA